MSYEYKTVGAPEKGKRRKGARTASDRAAVAFEEILQAEATDGWEYLRTDILPMIGRTGLFARVREQHHAVMVFRRPLATRVQPAGRDEGNFLTRAASAGPREPTISADPELRLTEAVRGPRESGAD